ncbi:nickel-dependent lactate racemase [Candidatus Poribacteria bacterium]|nr:nickel-dependent lactate racemase [Candidatus Poribacteria bacterium]
MLITMKYGKQGLDVEVPDSNLAGILRIKESRRIETPPESIRKALNSPLASKPLRELAKGKDTACIVISDITRPVPNKIILPPMLEILEDAGIKQENIVILVATGIHRPNEGEELEELIGWEIANNYRVVNHIARDLETHKHLGNIFDNIPVYVDKTYLQSDLKILTGLIEPHLMAGYSGGRKAICPGICSVETMRYMHGPHILEDERATTGVIEGNPFHEGASKVARMAGVDFILNVALNEEREITGVFAGDLEKAHLQGIKHVEQIVKVEVDEPADIVLVSNAGYPLDTNFYQAIKGMIAALGVIKEGGIIILVAECCDGLGGKEFTQLVLETTDVRAFVKKLYEPDFFVVDQWMLEELIKVIDKAQVYCYCEGVEDHILEQLSLKSIPSPELGLRAALKEKGENAKILVIPEGPYVLAVSRKKSV